MTFFCESRIFDSWMQRCQLHVSVSGEASFCSGNAAILIATLNSPGLANSTFLEHNLISWF